jgi:hypothetical protein
MICPRGGAGENPEGSRVSMVAFHVGRYKAGGFIDDISVQQAGF